MVVELKMNQSAESALAQIRERQYVEALADYKGKVLLAALAMPSGVK
jgi:hypothetical protein